MKVVLFNGPPGSGKDTLAKELNVELGLYEKKAICHKFAFAIKKPLKEMFNLSDEEYDFYFESPEKDKPQAKFDFKTPREVLISFSEKWAKPLFGQDIFGKIAGQYITDKYLKSKDFVIFSDCGFNEEVKGLTKYVGSANVMVFSILREGYHFSNDSRKIINSNDAGVQVFIVENNKTPIEVIRERVLPVLEEFNFVNKKDYVPF